MLYEVITDWHYWRIHTVCSVVFSMREKLAPQIKNGKILQRNIYSIACSIIQKILAHWTGNHFSNRITSYNVCYTKLLRNDITNAENQLSELYNKGEKAFALYTGENSYYLLVLKDKNVIKSLLPQMSDAYCQLDVSILHSLVLERLFGIDKENMANQKNLIYTRNFNEAISAVDNKLANCSFILNPTRVVEIKDVALASVV